MRPIIWRLSLGSILSKRWGPLGGCAPAPWTSEGEGLPGTPSMGLVGRGSGGIEKSRKELSDCRGAFQGNRRRVMQQKMMANDQTSAGWGSYLRSWQTSGARYGSEPTIPIEGISNLISAIDIGRGMYHVLLRFRAQMDIGIRLHYQSR